MVAKHGKSARIYVDEFDVSGDTNAVTPAFTVEVAETHGLTAAHKTRVAGQADSKLQVDSFWTNGTGGTDDVVSGYHTGTATALVTTCPGGVDDAAECYLLRDAICTASSPPAKLGAAVALSHSWESGAGADRMLVVYQDSPTASANGAGVDFGSAGAAGSGAAVIHVTSVTGAGTIDVKIQESSDNNVGDPWADEAGAAFTQLAAIGKERITWAGACERYIRVVITIAGFTGATIFVAAKTGGSKA